MNGHWGTKLVHRAAILMAAFAVGGGTALWVELMLLPAWFESSWVSQIGGWLIGGTEGHSVQWESPWDRIPSWAVSVVLGIVSGALAGRQFLWWTVPMAVGFVTWPPVRLLLLDAPIVFESMLLETVVIPFLVGGGTLGWLVPLLRRRHKDQSREAAKKPATQRATKKRKAKRPSAKSKR